MGSVWKLSIGKSARNSTEYSTLRLQTRCTTAFLMHKWRERVIGMLLCVAEGASLGILC